MSTSPTKPDAPRTFFARFLLPLLKHPLANISMGLGILLLDLVTNPLLMFPIIFVLPVVMCGWFCSLRLAYALTIMLSLGRFLTHTNFVETPQTITYSAVNGLVEVVVLSLLAFLVGRIVRQTKEIQHLHGLLHICMYCKRIRDKNENWQQLEAYISQRSEADFTHGLCPECAKKYYGDLFDTKRSA